jgi:hypothetical protein
MNYFALQTKQVIQRTLSSGMLCRVALLRADVLKERIASIIRVKEIGMLGTMLEVMSNRSTLQRITL